MSRRALSAVSTESRFWQPHISRMMWRPIAFMASPPPQDNGRDSAANPFDLVLDRANDDLFQAQPAAGEAFVDHLAYGRFDLGARGAMRLVNHPVGTVAHADADRGSHGVAWLGGDLDGVHRGYQRSRCDLGRFDQEGCILGQHATDPDEVQVAHVSGEERVIERV